MDLNKKIFKTEVAGHPVTLEISRIGEQANAAVLGRYGQTVVLATAVMSQQDRPVDFLPLTVDYEEKFYAVGKIMGSQYIRREGRASENAILSARLIDRTIRPLFNQDLRRDLQVVVTVLSLDPTFDPRFISLLSASTALAISDIPWEGPVAGVVVSQGADGVLAVNPPPDTFTKGALFDLFAAGTSGHINMIELEGREVSEDRVAAALDAAQQTITQLITFQQDIIRQIGQPKMAATSWQPDPQTVILVRAFLTDKLDGALYAPTKMARQDNLLQLQRGLQEHLANAGCDQSQLGQTQRLFETEVDALVRSNILERDRRPDLRRLDEVRDLHAEVGFLERVHGSALFIRGNTQALALTTLGPPDDSQAIETVAFEGRKHFLLHYNFPPYATGETGPFRGPGRREIGHGSLAEKSLRNLLPAKEQFPYTIRVVSEILSSNGSSSMASVCAGCLSLMDAGVPVKKMTAGIAMGLVSDDRGRHKILTDIQGPEDHYGDMDFKVAGTRDGVTAMQMDVKIRGLESVLIRKILAQAQQARLHIITAMERALAAPRPTISPYAPVVYQIAINPEKIGEVIGPGGKIINGIIARTGATGIDIEQTGTVYIYAVKREAAQAALQEIEDLTHQYQIGDMIEGKVVKILEFGAIVEFGPGRDGMIHVSELKNGYVKRVEDVVKIGDIVRAKIIRIEGDRTALSLKETQ